MKAIIKYISLLLFSGLILPFYNTGICKLTGNDQFKKNWFTQTNTITTHHYTTPITMLFLKEIADELFPVLKNKN